MSQAANVKTAPIAERTEQTHAQPTPEHIRQRALRNLCLWNGAPGDEVQVLASGRTRTWPEATITNRPWTAARTKN